MKPGNVPTSRLGPIIGDLVKDRWPHGGGYGVLAEKVGCDQSAIEGIVDQEYAGCEFDLADGLLCSLGRVDIWQGELSDVYSSVSIPETCERLGCSLKFHPKKQGGVKRRRFCSRQCRQMDWLARAGQINDTPKRNLKVRCRGGHFRTSENTNPRGQCLTCINVAQRHRHTLLTPEQREARASYQRGVYLRNKEPVTA